MIQELVEQIENAVMGVMNSGLHTAMPGVITAVDEGSGLVNVQPIGSFYCDDVEMEYPLIPSVPLVVAATPDGVSACGPVKAGDNCLIIIMEQSISAFLTDTKEAQLDERFQLMNAVCIPGLQKAMPEALAEANAEDAYIISAPGGKIKVSADGVTIESETVQITGDLDVSGEIHAGNIDAGSITARSIDSGSIRTDELDAPEG